MQGQNVHLQIYNGCIPMILFEWQQANHARGLCPGVFDCIERLGECYLNFEVTRDNDDELKRLYSEINRAVYYLDELWDGNDFDNGDKMRINKVRSVLRSVKEFLIREQKRADLDD